MKEMKRFVSMLTGVFIMFLTSNAQSVSTLNSYFSTYGHNIKTNNFFSPNTYISCIYRTNYMRADQQGKTLTLSFGYGWDDEYGYIYKCVLKIDLSSATFYTGYWSRGLLGNGKWQQYGKKEEITIEDKNGMDLTYTGEKNYNKGTKQDLISKIVVSFGTEPIANRVINELYGIQANYKAKEPWLLPEPEPQEVNDSSTSNMKTTNRTTTTKKPSSSSKRIERKSPTTKKVGKYVQ